jgi:hypothetical protein
MKPTLSTYVTVYKEIHEILDNRDHYRNVSVFAPITVSLNASGHTSPVQLATDLMRLWDILSGKDQLIDLHIPNDLVLYQLRNMARFGLLLNIGLRVVGIAGHPNLDIREPAGLEAIVSHLLTLGPEQAGGMVEAVTMAEHFASVARHAKTTHLWIFGQGDFAVPTSMRRVCAIFESGDVPDIISLPVRHSINSYLKEDELYPAVHMRYLEAISGSLYNRDFLIHMPEQGKRWWPHQESVMHEARTRAEAPRHLLLGKGGEEDVEEQCWVYVAPSPNWNKDQQVRDDVFIERYQVALHSLTPPSERLDWFFTLGDLQYCEGMVERGRMPAHEFDLMVAHLADAEHGSLRLKPLLPVIVPISGDLAQQVLSAAAYFRLKMDGHWAMADIAADQFKLTAFGLDQQQFTMIAEELPRHVYRFEAGNALLMRLGEGALAQARVRGLYDAAPHPGAPEQRLAAFEGAPYLCLRLARTPRVGALDALLTRVDGITDNLVVLSGAPLAPEVTAMLARHAKRVLVLDDGADYAALRILRGARIMVVGTDLFDRAGGAMAPHALVAQLP